MEKENWDLLEYEKLREELARRVNFLHQTINLTVVLLALFLGMTYLSIIFGLAEGALYTFLLFIPLIIDLLAFNYQSNQNSLESIVRYFHLHLKPILEKKYDHSVLGWEKFFAADKADFKLESLTKILPFILPSAIPFYFLFAQIPLENYQIAILFLDIFLLIFMLEGFRYKLRRVQ